MLKKSLVVFLIICAFFAILIGFIYKPFANEKPKVVVVLKGLDIEYWKVIKVGAEKGFREFDIDGKVIAPSYQSEEDVQERLLEDVLKEDPDVLVVSPVESSAVMSILKKIVEHKIPVLLLETDIPLENKTSYIGTDNFDLGRIAGELLASELQPGDAVALMANGDPIVDRRIAGAKMSLEAAGIKIVAEELKIRDQQSPGKKAIIRILERHPDVSGVFAATDSIAANSLEVIEKIGYHMPVVGTDGISDMLKKVEDGTLTATVMQNTYDMGYVGVETALKVIKGESVRKNIDTGIDLITKDNVKQKLDFLKELLR